MTDMTSVKLDRKRLNALSFRSLLLQFSGFRNHTQPNLEIGPEHRTGTDIREYRPLMNRRTERLQRFAGMHAYGYIFGTALTHAHGRSLPICVQQSLGKGRII